MKLTSVVCKVTETFVREKILDHLKNGKLLSENRHGFMTGRSFTTQLLEFLDIWSQILVDVDNIDMIYLDLAKAINTVPHRRLFKTLDWYGVQGNSWIWLREYLKDRKQYMVVNCEKSIDGEVTSGVPLISVIRSLLFLVCQSDQTVCWWHEAVFHDTYSPRPWPSTCRYN